MGGYLGSYLFGLSTVVTSINPSVSIMTIIVKASPYAIVSSMFEVDFKEFILELVNNFYKSLR